MADPERTYSAAQSGAFVELLSLTPTGSGPLDGLRFGVNPFAPTFDTVGILATSVKILTQAGAAGAPFEK